MSKIIKEYINDESPFGPVDSDQIEDQETSELLFDKTNDIYKNFNNRTAFILGRKGSGKTAFIKNTFTDKKNTLSIAIRTHTIFTNVQTLIERLPERLRHVEGVADIWEVIIWHIVFHKIQQISLGHDNQLRIINSYLKKLGITDRSNNEYIIGRVSHYLNGNETDSKPNYYNIDYSQYLSFENHYSYTECLDTTNKILSEQKFSAYVLFDSLEEFKPEEKDVNRAMSGLFKCIANFNRPQCNCKIKFCFPAELWHTLSSLSSNPLKDFNSLIVLHWHARELIYAAAHRLKLYIELYHPEHHHSIHNLNPDERDDAQKLFNILFPAQFKNSLGVEEAILPYILRHTQLLPRQFFSYLNSIFAENRRMTNSPLKITPQAVRLGIEAFETRILAEIFSAYKGVYPNARAVCEKVIQRLNYTFTQQELHKSCNALPKDLKRDIRYGYDHIQRMLIEIGCIGRKINETDRYHEAEYEYTCPNRLYINDKDILCLHPLFTRIFRAQQPSNKKFVYPFATDIDAPDFRNW